MSGYLFYHIFFIYQDLKKQNHGNQFSDFRQTAVRQSCKTSDYFTWIACRNAVCRDRAVDDAAGADYGVFSNGHSGQKNASAANPCVLFDFNRTGIGSEKGGVFLLPVRYKAFFWQNRMGRGIELHVGCNQNPAADADFLVVHKSAVHADDNVVTDKNIVAVIAVKGSVNRYIFSNAAEQLL